VEHRQHRYLNNRVENFHQPTRQRERRPAGIQVTGSRPALPRRVWAHHATFPSATPSVVRLPLPSRNAMQIRHLARTHHPPHRRIRVEVGGRHAPSCLMIMLAGNKLTKPSRSWLTRPNRQSLHALLSDPGSSAKTLPSRLPSPSHCSAEGRLWGRIHAKHPHNPAHGYP
jgi:hypothetical protein